MIFFPPAIIIYIFKQNKNKKTIKMTTLRDFFCLVRVSKNSSFYSIKATLLVLQNNNYTHPIFAMLNEKKVKKTVENKKTCYYYYYYYYYYRIIPDYTIILSRKKEIHIVIVLGHIFLGYILFHKLPCKCMFKGKMLVFCSDV